MGIFDSIKSALGFGDDEKNEEVSASAFGDAAAEAADNVAEVVASAAANLAGTSESAVEVVVDVAAKMDELQANSSEDMDWKNSIVDVMKLLGVDSSYAHRKELAAEVGIDGYHGTEEQNIELHKAVLAKLAANGGNIPADLLD